MTADTPIQGMPCPLCGIDLVMSERDGIEIDYCRKCRGVWLDRGELDKLIERAEARASQPSAPPSSWSAPVARGWTPSAMHGSHPYGDGRRKSWLREIFD